MQVVGDWAMEISLFDLRDGEGEIELGNRTWGRTASEEVITWTDVGPPLITIEGRYCSDRRTVKYPPRTPERLKDLFERLEKAWRYELWHPLPSGARVEGTGDDERLEFCVKRANGTTSGRLLFIIDSRFRRQQFVVRPRQLLDLADYIRRRCTALSGQKPQR